MSSTGAPHGVRFSRSSKSPSLGAVRSTVFPPLATGNALLKNWRRRRCLRILGIVGGDKKDEGG